MKLPPILDKFMLYLWHPIEGALTVFIGWYNMNYAWMWFIGFVVYEVDQDWINDPGNCRDAFKDLRDFLIGFVGTLLVVGGIKWIRG